MNWPLITHGCFNVYFARICITFVVTDKLLTREHGKRTADSEILQSESKRERTAMQHLDNNKFNNAQQENGRPSGETKGSTLHCDFTVYVTISSPLQVVKHI